VVVVGRAVIALDVEFVIVHYWPPCSVFLSH
jgi:hypothetical protein